MVLNVKDLSAEQRGSIEALIGERLSDRDGVSIRKLTPPAAGDPIERRQAFENLEQYFSRVDAKRPEVSSGEAEDIINEALRSTRPNYRPAR